MGNDKERARRKLRYSKHKASELASNAKWRAAHPDYMRKLRGLPDATRPKPELCECCQTRTATHLDHDHKTGAFRGWLCGNCNRGLGQLGDDVDSVMRAMSYLTRLYDYDGKEVNLWTNLT